MSDRIILARRGSRSISAVFDGEKFDDWQARNASGTVLGWSRPKDRKDNVGGELGSFFTAAREHDFETAGFEPTPEGRRAARLHCNCNPDEEPVQWKPVRVKGAPLDRAPNRLGLDSKGWAKHLHQLGQALAPKYAELAWMDEAEARLHPGISFKGCDSMAEVLHREAVAKADLALLHARQDEARRQAHERALRDRRAAMGRGEEVAPLPKKARQSEADRKAKHRASDAARRNLERIARAAAEAKRDEKNRKARERRAAKKGKP